MASDEIVDFRKFRCDEYFKKGLGRIEDAYDKGFTLCLMCSEKKPMNCHRYFLICKALENRFNEWLDIRHIVEISDGTIGYISNEDLDKQLEKIVCEKKVFLAPCLKTPSLINIWGKMNKKD